ncbi:MAG: hypothetical protein H6999_08005 [Hahellaceae bacterium]|nr:hypothetical protein [Hahellaceae bacterium]MCP5169686.1 hypothetical protein [Hahellaceae bacterium]
MRFSEIIEKQQKQQEALAVKAASWYLVNLLLLPGIAFLVLFRLYLRHGSGNPAGLGVNHVRQAFWMSILGGSLVLLGSGGILLLMGNSPDMWATLIVYFTIVHSSFVMWGVLALAWAMAGKSVLFPSW